ncbi:MAG: RNA polymerase factor sigma-54 [Candidatus Omnitrophica bacterium]|nr:RNA polymerase factor sigma-54 [Candidatus Omnitrophota bacterium]
MEQRMFLEQRLSQKMVMTPRMQQAIKMLQMPTIELESVVDQEMMENPLLEEIPTEDLQSPDNTESMDGETEWAEKQLETEAPTEGEKLSEGKIELNDDWEKFFEDGSDHSYTATTPGFNGPLDEEFDRIIPDDISLRSELERQLDTVVKTETDREIGMALLNSLDQDGYLGQSVEETADQTGHEIQEVERVLNLIHRFEPAGIGARDLSECLEIQYHHAGCSCDNMLTIIRNHLKDLEHKRYQNIARALKITTGEVQELADRISRFEPRPGRKLVAFENEYVTPDVFVEKIGGEWQVRINDDGIAPLRISPKYRQMLENRENLDKETVKYLRNRLHSAVDLIKNIEQRKQTLYRVTKEIVSQQEEFLENGVLHLKPMRLRDVADVVGVHETTVCRVVNGKYVDTPQGLFELKYFFSTGLGSDDGEDASAKSVMAMVQDLIDNEDPKKPLSDQKISDKLKAEGVNVARRTVAKYRDIMGILPTSMRKRV